MEKLLKNGTKIRFELTPEIFGKGYITGIASMGAPVIGKTYIVEYEELSTRWDYPQITVFENQISKWWKPRTCSYCHEDFEPVGKEKLCHEDFEPVGKEKLCHECNWGRELIKKEREESRRQK